MLELRFGSLKKKGKPILETLIFIETNPRRSIMSILFQLSQFAHEASNKTEVHSPKGRRYSANPCPSYFIHPKFYKDFLGIKRQLFLRDSGIHPTELWHYPKVHISKYKEL
jgi:hypothetical protein